MTMNEEYKKDLLEGKYYKPQLWSVWYGTILFFGSLFLNTKFYSYPKKTISMLFLNPPILLIFYTIQIWIWSISSPCYWNGGKDRTASLKRMSLVNPMKNAMMVKLSKQPKNVMASLIVLILKMNWNAKSVLNRFRNYRCWWHCDVGDFKLVTICECSWLNFDVGDIFWMLVLETYLKRQWVFIIKTCHQHLQVVTNSFRIQHLSPTSM